MNCNKVSSFIMISCGLIFSNIAYKFSLVVAITIGTSVSAMYIHPKAGGEEGLNIIHILNHRVNILMHDITTFW